VRLFFAVDFSEAVKSAIAAALEAVPVKNPPWRWIAADNLHLTLKFLGERPDEDVAALGECAASAVAQLPSFHMSLGRFGGFPNLGNPRVLFYGVEDGAPPLRDLASRLDGELSTRMRIEPEKRPFKAHATVARVKTRLPAGIVRKLEAVPPLEGVTQQVDSVVLMKSELSPQGARYHALKAFALSKSK
jgi:2'-5' RNA ligase